MGDGAEMNWRGCLVGIFENFFIIFCGTGAFSSEVGDIYGGGVWPDVRYPVRGWGSLARRAPGTVFYSPRRALRGRRRLGTALQPCQGYWTDKEGGEYALGAKRRRTRTRVGACWPTCVLGCTCRPACPHPALHKPDARCAQGLYRC